MSGAGEIERIGPVIVIGAVVYIAIAVWQAVVNPGVIPEAAAIAVLLGVFCSLLAINNPYVMKKGEIAAVWTCILLFAVYGLLRIGGIL